MEDLDRPRVVPGADQQILGALQKYGLEWDGEVVYQSQRTALYDDALARLREAGAVFDCACSRAELQRAASAPAESELIYPGTCRNGLPPGRVARALRFRAPEVLIAFDDLLRGRLEEDVERDTGDFVVKRADGVFAYQLAVVVDDGAQGITQVVRGADLLSSTARQIALQRALGYSAPQYAHVPLVLDEDGAKLGKRTGALPLDVLDEKRIAETMRLALRHLGVQAETLEEALKSFRQSPLPAGEGGAKRG